MTWHIERDEDGLPVRMVWSPDEPGRQTDVSETCPACHMGALSHLRGCLGRPKSTETGEA